MLAVPWNKSRIPECSYKPELDVAVVLALCTAPEMWMSLVKCESCWYQAVVRWVERRRFIEKEQKLHSPKMRDLSPVWHNQILVIRVYCLSVWSVQDCFLSSVAGNHAPGSAFWSMDCIWAVPFISHEEIPASVPNEYRLLPHKLNRPWTEGKSIYHLQSSEEPPVAFTKYSHVLITIREINHPLGSTENANIIANIPCCNLIHCSLIKILAIINHCLDGVKECFSLSSDSCRNWWDLKGSISL